MRHATNAEVETLPYNEPFVSGHLRLFYTTEDNEFMGMAMLEAVNNSTDRKHRTGAVTVYHNRVMSQRTNMAGYKNSFAIWLHEKGLCTRRFLKVKSGERYDLCRGCASPKNHAESRAADRVLEIYPTGLEGGVDLYLWGHYWCCKDCCNAMIKAGINRVILLEGAKERFGR